MLEQKRERKGGVGCQQISDCADQNKNSGECEGKGNKSYAKNPLLNPTINKSGALC